MKYTNKIIIILIIIIIVIVAFNLYQRYLVTKKINDAKDKIIIDSPEPYQNVKNPIYIMGKAKGSFFFEGTFPVRIEDENGNIIMVDHIETKDDWMTENFVSFEKYLDISNINIKKGFIVFEKANPSGLPENKFEIKIPIYIK
ncbi:MAG: Gmad2 immunoglobulin-like domain-containing protein [Candidatus Pelagibacter ubique]